MDSNAAKTLEEKIEQAIPEVIVKIGLNRVRCCPPATRFKSWKAAVAVSCFCV